MNQAALNAAGRGWHVFPLRPDSKRPAFPDHDERHCTRRDPRCRNGHTGWEPRATTDTTRITRAWTRTPYNVGIACGPSRLVVVDLDTPKPGDTPPREWDRPGIRTGADVLAALCDEAGQPYPAATYTVSTPSGGTHLYFTAPAGAGLRNTAGALGWLVDTRAGGGYVVGAASTVNGRRVPRHPGHTARAAARVARRPATAHPAAPATSRSGIPAGRAGRGVPAGRGRGRASPRHRVTATRAQHRALPRLDRARATRRRGAARRAGRNHMAHRRGRTSRAEAGGDGPHHRIWPAGRCQAAPEHRGMNAPNPRNLRIVRPGETAPAEAAPARPRTAWTADELMAENFPPARWAVPGVERRGGFLRFWPFPALVMARESAAWAAWLAAAPCR